MMHEILLNTTHFENNNLMTEKTMMTFNHLVQNMTPITETDIIQFLTKLTHKEQTNNLHHGFSPTDSMLLNQRETEWTKTVCNEEEDKSM